VTLKINPDTDVIEDIRFKTFGCGSAIASSSALTELAKGRTLDEAMKITNQEIADFLDGLPPEKMHCSVMGREALENAINDYRGIKTENHHDEETDIVCKCFMVTRTRLEKLIKKEKLTDLEGVMNFTKAGGGCGHCKPDIQKIIDQVNGTVATVIDQKSVDFEGFSVVQRIQAISAKIDGEIRSALALHGGDIEFVNLEGYTVQVKLRGACQGCAGATQTLKHYVEERLRSGICEKLTVEEVR
jgi:NifU-like protein